MHEKRCYVKSRAGFGRCPFGAGPSSPAERANSVLFVPDEGCRGWSRRVDSTCAEHGARVGRSRTERPYAEAKSQSVRGTKPPPARRIHGPAFRVLWKKC